MRRTPCGCCRYPVRPRQRLTKWKARRQKNVKSDKRLFASHLRPRRKNFCKQHAETRPAESRRICKAVSRGSPGEAPGRRFSFGPGAARFLWQDQRKWGGALSAANCRTPSQQADAKPGLFSNNTRPAFPARARRRHLFVRDVPPASRGKSASSFFEEKRYKRVLVMPNYFTDFSARRTPR